MIVDVYLPVLVRIDTETGEAKDAFTDWEGAPWLFLDDTENVWWANPSEDDARHKPDEEIGEFVWTKDAVFEGMAETALAGKLSGLFDPLDDE